MPIFKNSKIKLQEGIYNLCGFYKYEKTLDLSDIQSEIYQKNYISFYRLRRDKDWNNQYFNFLEIYYKKHQKGVNCFRDILQDLYKVLSKSKKGVLRSKIEMSFASKLLHTIDPDFPIWDSQVRKKLKINDSIKTIDDGDKAYKKLCACYASMKNDPQFKTLVSNFDSLFPKFSGVTETKKIDFYLWL